MPRIETYRNGALLTAIDVPDDPQTVNADDMRAKMQQAIAVNVAFLRLAPPTTGQTLTQVQRLTRQVTAIEKLMLGLFDDTDGT